MTHLKGIYVALENDIGEEQAAKLIAAITQLRGVLSVETNVANFDDWIISERIRRELAVKLRDVLYPPTIGNAR